ncbi:hypothetical protein U1P98_15265 [Lysinibacillus irui]|uniref:Uncharacterized protein n=1 Tax=Lysinibacillus irui TaxID=2998077 RepID=A0ABU5NNP4_9BACI|nr:MULTISPECIES: hypothetical protein [Lysinibacillus]MEA0555324.1 hypothetical protein [Lysinibacillus irui]MEA0977668.1 hypothetical protein [Lysinibacillus irui]MEA1043822.1 hypothetical protein [Lysinibacillus irui]
MDNQLIAKITELVLEKLTQATQSDQTHQTLTNEELQEWQSFQLMQNHGQKQQPKTDVYEALSAHELHHWQSLHEQQLFTTTDTNDLIALKKFT